MKRDTETDPVAAAIQRGVDPLRAAKCGELVQRWRDNPELYRQTCEEARQRAKSSPLFQTLDLIRYFER